METLKKLTNEIVQLTGNIEENYPELYQYLDENPITVSKPDESTVNYQDLRDYLESLKELLKHHKETH